MKKLFVVILALFCTLSVAQDITFSCYKDGDTRCFPSMRSSLDIAVDLVRYGESTGASYQITADRKNKMVTIVLDGKSRSILEEAHRQGLRPDAISALLGAHHD